MERSSRATRYRPPASVRAPAWVARPPTRPRVPGRVSEEFRPQAPESPRPRPFPPASPQPSLLFVPASPRPETVPDQEAAQLGAWLAPTGTEPDPSPWPKPDRP